MFRRRYLTEQVGGLPPTFTISGTVYDADGSTAVASATVALGALTATSAANGTYTISNVPPSTAGLLTCTKTGYAWDAKIISAMSGNLTAQNYTNAWWAVGGIGAGCIAAYAPEGSFDYLHARLNQKYDDTYILSWAGLAGVFVQAPWTQADGWAFDGATTRHVFRTGIIPAAGQTSFIKLKNQQLNQPLFGVSDSGGPFRIFPNHTNGRIYQNGGSGTNAGAQTSGTFCMVNKTPYYNGVAEATAIGAGTQVFVSDIYLGGCNGATGGPANAWASGNVLAYAHYNTTLTAPQVLALHNASQALPTIAADTFFRSYFLRQKHDATSLAAQRTTLAAVVWPTGAPATGVDTITSSVSNPMGVTPSNLARTDSLLFHLANSIDMTGYLFVPTSPNNKLVIFGSGHNISQWISGQEDMVKELVEANYTVVAIRMPLGSDGTYNTLHNGTTGGGTLLSQFVDPIYRAINQYTGYDAYYVTGHSGGGWMAAFAAALDERITRSAPCNSPMPSYCLENGGTDWEQGRPGFNFTLEWTDLFLMGCTSNRKTKQFLNDQDAGGFNLTNYNKKPYLAAVQYYESDFDLWWGTSATHSITAAQRAAVLAFFAT